MRKSRSHEIKLYVCYNKLYTAIARCSVHIFLNIYKYTIFIYIIIYSFRKKNDFSCIICSVNMQLRFLQKKFYNISSIYKYFINKSTLKYTVGNDEKTRETKTIIIMSRIKYKIQSY